MEIEDRLIPTSRNRLRSSGYSEFSLSPQRASAAIYDINRMTKHRCVSWTNDGGRDFTMCPVTRIGVCSPWLSVVYNIHNSGKMCKLLSSFAILTIVNIIYGYFISEISSE